MEILYFEQGSLDWHAARCGIPTASCIADVFRAEGIYASGPRKGQPKVSDARTTYLYELAGEQFTGKSDEPFVGRHTERGHALEPEARALWIERTGMEVQQVGIIINNGVGYSPDGLVGDDGIIEIKTKLPKLLIPVLLAGAVPDEHMPQIQCGLWVSERKWCDFICYWPGMPLIVIRVERDKEYINKMAVEVRQFYAELEAIIEKIMEAA